MSNRRAAQKCQIEGCESAVLAKGLCGAHYQKLRTRGDPLSGGTRGKNGTGYIDSDGYIRRSEKGVEKPEHVRAPAVQCQSCTEI